MTSYKNMSKDLKAIVDTNRKIVFELFDGRCLLNPSHKSAVIHEIEPKSIRPTDWWELDNMAPLCVNCHDLIHASGAKTYKKVLERLRNESR